MTDARWRFAEKRPSDKTRDPIQGEFFSTEAIKSASEALVREGIQNSLDARISPEHTLRVRIRVSGQADAVPAERHASYFGSAWKHLHARDNGLIDPPGPDDPCPFLVFEDFGTTGLNGDVAQHFAREGTENPFYYFFRAEGRSSKADDSLGRFGIGKYVFPKSSRIKSFFGLTTRTQDKRTLLVGQAVLRSHVVGNRPFHPDGWYGTFRADELPLPIEDEDAIQRFCDDFQLARRGEAGLSVVVPFCLEDLNANEIAASVIVGFFLPILRGRLTVEIVSPAGVILLDAASLDQHVRDFQEQLDPGTAGLIDLARFMRKGDSIVAQAKPPSLGGAIHWHKDLLETEAAASIRERLAAGDPAGVRFHLSTIPKQDTPRPAHFDVYLRADEQADRSKPVFVREDIRISDVKAGMCRGYQALVVVDRGPLASALGDAENPAHTEWQTKAERITAKYRYAPSHIRFVTDSVRNLLDALHSDEEDKDYMLLADIFPQPARNEESPRRKKRKLDPEGEDDDGQEVDPPPPKYRQYGLEKIDGGFQVVRGDPKAELPRVLQVRVAYDLRRGNPFKRYMEHDFRFGHRPIRIEHSDKASIEIVGSNELRIHIRDPGFCVKVTGFDRRRDIIVDAKVIE